MNKAYIIDNLDEGEWKIDYDYLERLEDNVKKAKEKADIVILLMHSGGQFNLEVGEFTEKITNYLSKLQIDLIIGNHPHIVQKYEIKNKKPIFFSLGNFIFSPCSEYVNDEGKPEYSIKVNTYWNKKENKIESIKFEILKVILIRK